MKYMFALALLMLGLVANLPVSASETKANVAATMQAPSTDDSSNSDDSDGDDSEESDEEEDQND